MIPPTPPKKNLNLKLLADGGPAEKSFQMGFEVLLVCNYVTVKAILMKTLQG